MNKNSISKIELHQNLDRARSINELLQFELKQSCFYSTKRKKESHKKYMCKLINNGKVSENERNRLKERDL